MQGRYVDGLNGRGIPLRLVVELVMYLEYATPLRVAIKLLAYTGCRLSEIRKMRRSNIVDGFLFWQCGKNQTESRKEFLPPDFMTEIDDCMKRSRHRSDIICDLCGKTVLREFNKLVRPNLSSEWREQRVTMQNEILKYEYKYQLRGLRKNFATLLFWHLWKKYDSSEVALEMVSKRMRHSSQHMTAYHYVESADQIEAAKYAHLLPFELVATSYQARIGDY